MLSKKDDKLTDGNKKNVKAQYIASETLLNNFFVKIKTRYEETPYKDTGIIFSTKKLSPKIKVIK